MSDELFAAISAGESDTVRSLVAATPSLLDATAPNGVSPILFVLYNGKREVADALQSSGAPLSIFDAAATGNAGQVRSLLAATPALATEWSADGFTALHYAAFFGGDVDVARALVRAGADGHRSGTKPDARRSVALRGGKPLRLYRNDAG